MEDKNHGALLVDDQERQAAVVIGIEDPIRQLPGFVGRCCILEIRMSSLACRELGQRRRRTRLDAGAGPIGVDDIARSADAHAWKAVTATATRLKQTRLASFAPNVCGALFMVVCML
jgi:hypothetical protein